MKAIPEPDSKDLAIFVRIDIELFEERSERSRINRTSLNGEIPAIDATTFFNEAAREARVCPRRCHAIVPDRLIADPQFGH